MRKWMRERLKRRKKSQAEAPQAAPLQPAYFDAEQPKAARETPAAESSLQEELSGEPVSAPEPAAADVSSGDTASTRPLDGVRRPRRRRRGGRGRRRSGPAASSAAPAADTAAAAPAPIPSAPVRQVASKGVVVLAIGLPGSGKSSWFKRHKITPLSSDLVRAMLFDDLAEQRFQDLVFSNLRSMLRARLIARRPLNYVDATNLTPQERAGWIKLAKDFGYEAQAVYFDVPLEVCLERNQRRQRVVEEDVMRRMAAKLKAPAFDEGFSRITVVRVKQKE